MTMSYIIARISKAVKINPRIIFFAQPMPSVFSTGDLRIHLHVFAFPASCWPKSSLDSRPLSTFWGFRPPYFMAGLLQQPSVCFWSPGSGAALLQILSRRHKKVGSLSEGTGGAGHFVSDRQNIWCQNIKEQGVRWRLRHPKSPSMVTPLLLSPSLSIPIHPSLVPTNIFLI